MERIQIKVSKTPPGVFKCARLGCADRGVHRINERHNGEWIALYQDFCELHYMEFMNNGLLDVVQDT
jgi:hypothetical protein